MPRPSPFSQIDQAPFPYQMPPDGHPELRHVGSRLPGRSTYSADRPLLTVDSAGRPCPPYGPASAFLRTGADGATLAFSAGSERKPFLCASQFLGQASPELLGPARGSLISGRLNPAADRPGAAPSASFDPAHSGAGI